MTEARLDPRVHSLLAEALDERSLDMETVEQMLDETQRLEGEELEARLREILEAN